VIEPVTVNGVTVSSSQIRQYLVEGQVGKANAMLGDVYSVSGIVVHGKKIGASLGFPTINLHQEERKLLPKCGVYATITNISGQDYQSITNVGIRPTFFDDGEVTVETHILDFNENCYSKHVSVGFVQFISEEIKLADKQALKEKIADDVVKTRQYFSGGN
jgi:riboflavin kinase / FMN adenylyltransferase